MERIIMYNNWMNFIDDIFSITRSDTLINNLKMGSEGKIDRFFPVKFDCKENKDSCFDYSTNPKWRKFLLSVYYADVFSYAQKDDQVDFPRLLYLVNAFPEGFTVWWVEKNNKLYPVGYTGWYYVEKHTFDRIAQMRERNDIVITNRFFLPAKNPTPYIYLFNYSISPELKGTVYSRTLIKEYTAEIGKISYQGLFCATVSPDGIRVAKKFGMEKIGALKSDDGSDSDDIYFLRREEH
jgi:hypothetical protein